MSFQWRTVGAAQVLLLAICVWAVESAGGGDPVTIRLLNPKVSERERSPSQTAMTSGQVRLKTEFLQGVLVSDPFEGGRCCSSDDPHGECHITVATSVSKRLMTVELRRLPRTEPVSCAAVSLPRDFDPMAPCDRGDVREVERVGRDDGRGSARS
jgi:hypothetical protein